MRRAEPERRAQRLVRWYPRDWRRRYGEEFTQLLADDIEERPRSWRRTLDVAQSGLTARVTVGSRPWSRLAAAFVFIAALAGAAVLRAVVDPHQEIKCPPLVNNPQAACLIVPGHGWVNATAVAVAAAGAIAASGLLLTPLLQPRRRRVAAAVTILGLVGTVALWVATFRRPVPVVVSPGHYPGARVSPSPAWAVAEATLIGVAVVGAALAVLWRRRALTPLLLAVVVLILGLALVGGLIPHVVAVPGGRIECDPGGPPGRGCGLVAVRRWVEPAALALCALGAAGAAGLLLTRRRRG